MRKGLTEIVLVLDRSGSMQSIRHDAEGGLQAFVRDQRKAPGEAHLTFYRFDDTVERVLEDVNLQFVQDVQLKLEPRGSTALFDALARAINEVGERLSRRSEAERPEHVVVLAVTDGEENASKEYPRWHSSFLNSAYGQWLGLGSDGASRIAAMIKRQREQYNWQFVFIGSTEESIKTAQDLGYGYSVTLANSPTGSSYRTSYNIMSSNVTAMRSGGGAQSLNFTEEQRAKAKDDVVNTAKSA
jgi:hypothetical protein